MRDKSVVLKVAKGLSNTSTEKYPEFTSNSSENYKLKDSFLAPDNYR